MGFRAGYGAIQAAFIRVPARIPKALNVAGVPAPYRSMS